MSKRKMTLGLIVGNRGFFPSHLCSSGRAEVLEVLGRAGLDVLLARPEVDPARVAAIAATTGLAALVAAMGRDVARCRDLLQEAGPPA